VELERVGSIPLPVTPQGDFMSKILVSQAKDV